MLLYRYFDETGLKATLSKGLLRVSRLISLNDPFEWLPGVHHLMDLPEVRSLAESCVDSALQEVNQTIGVVCFSAVANESVLWSHYADEHRGGVLELEIDRGPDTLIKIEYSDERPSFSAARLREKDWSPQGHAWQVLRTLIERKSLGWAYEKEFRLYKSLEKCQNIDGFYYSPLSEANLRRVILGWKCPLNETEVAHDVGNYPVVRACLYPQSYKLMIPDS